MQCLNGVAVVGDQTPAIAAKGRWGEVAVAEPRSASLPLLLPLESLLGRQCWERRPRPLAVAAGEAVILPAPEVDVERMKEVEEAVLAVMTARQTRVAAVLGRSAEQEPTIYWMMVYERWAGEAASSLSEEAGPSMKPKRWVAQQLSS